MILIYGKGKVGQGVAALCGHLGLAHEIRDDADGATDFSRYDAIVPSPGVPQTHAAYATGKVVAELDFGYRHLPKGFKIAAVTGTDGKSTTTWALYHALRAAGGGKARITGNWDESFCATVLEILRSGEASGWLAVEVSSFMAYAIQEFSPDWSVFTNFESDHLNWHPDLGEYFRAKWRLMERTKSRCVTTPDIVAKARTFGIDVGKIPLRTFGAAGLADRVEDGRLVVAGVPRLRLDDARLKGAHNAFNLLAVAAVADEAGLDPAAVDAALADVGGLPHRIETVGTAEGVAFVDDSKATTPQALRAALSAFERPVVLIAGGSDKGADFMELAPDFSQKVAKAFLIGVTRGAVAKGLGLAGRPYEILDEEKDGTAAMRWAVDGAFAAARELGAVTVLLSPGCASFGLFKDYADRAEKFRAEAKNATGFRAREGAEG